MNINKALLVGCIALLALLVTGCGDTDDDGPGGVEPGTDSVSTDAAVGTGLPAEDTANLDDAGAGSPDPGTESSAMTLSIQPVFDAAALELGMAYTATDSTQVQVDGLRFWISNVILTDVNDTQHAVPACYYLFEYTAEKVRDSVTIEDIPSGDYKALSLAVGVDSAHNHSLDLFEGELSTAVDMHWSWGSGFIFLKIDGQFSDGGSWSGFNGHVGMDDNFEAVTLTFDAPITIGDGHETTVQLVADLQTLLADVDLSATPSVTMGPGSQEYADGFHAWFSLTAPTSAPE